MWSKHPQYTIGATESGKPIGFHYTEGEDGEGRFNRLDHHEAATLHDKKRNMAAQRAGEYDKLGLKGAANGFRRLAQHHAAQASLHMAKVLPAAQKQPQVRFANQKDRQPSQPRVPVNPRKV